MKWTQPISKSSTWDPRLPCDSWLFNHNMWWGRRQFPSGTRKPDPTLIHPAVKQEAPGSPTDPRVERFHGDDGTTDNWGLMRSYEGHPHASTLALITSSSLDRLSISSSSSSSSSLSDPRQGKIGCTSGNWPFSGTATVQSCLSNRNHAREAPTSSLPL